MCYHMIKKSVPESTIDKHDCAYVIDTGMPHFRSHKYNMSLDFAPVLKVCICMLHMNNANVFRTYISYMRRSSMSSSTFERYYSTMRGLFMFLVPLFRIPEHTDIKQHELKHILRNFEKLYKTHVKDKNLLEKHLDHFVHDGCKVYYKDNTDVQMKRRMKHSPCTKLQVHCDSYKNEVLYIEDALKWVLHCEQIDIVNMSPNYIEGIIKELPRNVAITTPLVNGGTYLMIT
jgi:hypothetical protein